MSGYVGGVLVILCINVILAYAVFLPVAAGQLNSVAPRSKRSAPIPRAISLQITKPCRFPWFSWLPVSPVG